ncbi:MAG: phytanoyl-CoA dioxygenase family protein [Bacteroidia bacterium]|nr:phytanoyl-CoA dioxygenase family protein [Bacteroidia bacterium]
MTLHDITTTAADWEGDFGKGMTVLNKTGVVRIPGYFSQETIADLNRNFDELLAMNDGGVRKIDYSNGRAVTVDLNTLSQSSFPVMFDVFRNAKFDAITKKYLNRPDVKANNSVYVVNDVVGTRHMANDLHFDVQRTLKFFVYLNDCSAVNGAFACVPGSQNFTAKVRLEKGDQVNYENRMMSRDLPAEESDVVSVEGPAGTLIIFDTDVFHRTGIVSEGERRVMRGQSNFIDELNNPKSAQKKKGWLSGLFGK